MRSTMKWMLNLRVEEKVSSLKIYSNLCITTLSSLNHWFLSIPHENIRKPKVFWCFQGVLKEIICMKLINETVAFTYISLSIYNGVLDASKREKKNVKECLEVGKKYLMMICCCEIWLILHYILTFSWRWFLSYRNQSIDLQSKSMD